MSALKIAAAFSSLSAGKASAKSSEGLLLSATSQETAHLPFAALLIGTPDDLSALSVTADVGLYLVSERNILNKPLSALDMAPGIFWKLSCSYLIYSIAFI